MRSIWVLAGAALMLLAQVPPACADAAIAAVWKEQRLSFFYRGRTSRYSCEGLRDKVRAMLLDLGVRRDLQLTALGCEDSAQRARLASLGPSLHIVFSAPALPAAGRKPLHTEHLGVDARFESFTITSDPFRNMGMADCELVEAFARQILPKLATRNVKQDVTCVPFQQSGGRFLIQGEILRVMPPR